MVQTILNQQFVSQDCIVYKIIYINALGLPEFGYHFEILGFCMVWNRPKKLWTIWITNMSSQAPTVVTEILWWYEEWTSEERTFSGKEFRLSVNMLGAFDQLSAIRIETEFCLVRQTYLSETSLLILFTFIIFNWFFFNNQSARGELIKLVEYQH